MHSNRNRRRNLAVAVTGITAAVTLVGCAAAAPSGSSAINVDNNKKVHIALALVSASLPFAEETRKGAEAAAKQFNVQLDVIGPPIIDPPTAISQVENALSTGVDGIAIADEPATLWTRALKDADSKTNGNVVTFNTIPVKGSPVTSYVGIDAADYGTDVANETVKASGVDKNITGDVLVGDCFPGSEPLAITSNAVVARLKQLLPKADVLPFFDSKITPADNSAAWEHAIAAHPNTVLTIDTCDQGGDSMLKAKQQSGMDFAIGTVQTSPNILAAIKSGQVAVAVPQHNYVVGYTVIRMLADAIRSGKKLPQGWIDPGYTAVTKANVAAAVERDSGDAGLATFYKPVVSALWNDLGSVTKPLSEVQK
jgi:ribose transport system substrate-binding protein